MRGTRWLLLVAIAAVICGVGIAYRARRTALREQAPARPQPLADAFSATAGMFHHRVTDTQHDRLLAEVFAKDFKQVKDTSEVQLNGVQLNLYGPDGTSYDLVKCASAVFDPGANRFKSDEEVEITLRVPVQGQPQAMPMSIKTSGVVYDTASGRAETDGPAHFSFRYGEGSATGAYYDPAAHDLVLRSQVVLYWRPPGRPEIKIEASSLTYKEGSSEIWLKPWGKLTRANMIVEGLDGLVRLGESAAGETYIRQVEANQANGSDAYPNRKLKYSAGTVLVDFDESGEMQKISGAGKTRLVSTAAVSETSVNAERVEMMFEIANQESALTKVHATGNGEVVSRPLPAPGRLLPETHVLRSENLDMKMRPGGHEVERVETHAPGTVEFLPNQPSQRRRTLDGKDLVIEYAAQNQVESFRASDARTRTEPNADERKRNRTTAITTSRTLLARFDPKTGRTTTMEQTGDFTYQEGERRARAVKASMDVERNAILLDASARYWDATGSISADRIQMDQNTNEMTAEGNVNSSRLPDKNTKTNSEMLSAQEPLQAQSKRMETKNRGRWMRYEGGAVMWQGANRIQADVIDVDRDKRTLTANGSVVTDVWEQPKQQQPSGGAVRTIIRAPRMVYTEEGRLAHYTGGVKLTRDQLAVASSELRAFLAESGADSSLDKAYADGAVQIVQKSPERTRTGTGIHAEYYSAEQKMVLRGSNARLVDTVKGTSEGSELIYFANDDRLLGSGAPDNPVKSRVKRIPKRPQ